MVNGIGLLPVAITVVVFAMEVYETIRHIQILKKNILAIDLQEGLINLWEQEIRIQEVTILKTEIRELKERYEHKIYELVNKVKKETSKLMIQITEYSGMDQATKNYVELTTFILEELVKIKSTFNEKINRLIKGICRA